MSAYLARLANTPLSAGLRAYAEPRVGLITAPDRPAATEDAHAEVMRVARDAAIDLLRHTKRPASSKVRHLARGRMRFRHVPLLLRERAEATISAADLDRLYGHLDRCPECADVARRFEAAEWHLHEALSELPSAAPAMQHQPPATLEAPVPATDALDPSSWASEPDPPPAAASNWAPQPEAPPTGPARWVPQPKAPPAAASSWAPPPEAPPTAPSVEQPVHAGNGAPRTARGSGGSLGGFLRGLSPWVIGGSILALVVAGGAIALVASGRLKGGASHPATSSSPTAASGPRLSGSPTPAAPVPPAGGAPVQVHAARVQFTLAGLQLTVFGAPQEPWTRFVKHVPAGPGQRWELVTVRVTNLTRAGFDPRVLHFRLADARGQTYYPDRKAGTGPAVGRPPHPLARGQLGQAEVAFRVPQSASGLSLLFNPTTQRLRLQVPLDR